MEMEHSRKPIVAAIMGSCLGGGLEVRQLQLYESKLSHNHQCKCLGCHGLSLPDCCE